MGDLGLAIVKKEMAFQMTNSPYSYPQNIINSNSCSADYKVFMLLSALCRDVVSHLKINERKHTELTTDCIFRHGTIRKVFIDLSNSLRININDITKNTDLLAKLILAVNDTYGHDMLCLSLSLYQVEFVSQLGDAERARLCRKLYLQDSSNLRALYLYSFYRDVGGSLSANFFRRFRLYIHFAASLSDLSNHLYFSPTMGISVGHWANLAGVLLENQEVSDVTIYTSITGIGSEILDKLYTMSSKKINVKNWADEKNIENLSNAFFCDFTAGCLSLADPFADKHNKASSVPLISLHLRTEGYKKQGGIWNELRNSDPRTFELLGKIIGCSYSDLPLIKRICCPDDLRVQDSKWSTHIVSNKLSAKRQWDLLENSTHFIGCNSGISGLAPSLARSCLIVNATSLWGGQRVSKSTVFALKRVSLPLCQPVVSVRDFFYLLYLDWVYYNGIQKYFNVHDLDELELCNAYQDFTHNNVTSFKRLCIEFEVPIPPHMPDRLLTCGCAKNITNIADTLSRNFDQKPIIIEEVMWG